MPGVRGVRFLFLSLLVISVLFLPAISADETTGGPDLAIVPGPVHESCTISVNRSVTVATILPTPVPLVPETLSPVESCLMEPAPSIPAPAETPARPPATTGAIIQPTVTSTQYPEVTLLPAAYATTAPVPSDARTLTVDSTGQVPAPQRTLMSSRQETPASLDTTSHTTLRPQKGATGKAPVNPAFLAYQNHTEQSAAEESRARKSTTIVFNDGTTSQVVLEGEIPSPIDFTYTRELPVSPGVVSLDGGYGYPSSFDLRLSGRVSPVKNQGRAGSCWAFAAIASLESSLLPGETWDFSENNLKNTLAGTYMDGFDRDWSDGGNREMSTAYLTRWSGPVRESEDPYSDVSGLSPAGLHSSKHVQDVYFLPERSGFSDNTRIKEALMNRGAVQTSIYWSDAYYNAAGAAFYNNRTSSTNHAITLVGWDDTYSRMNFVTPPEGDGAFIAKNSWGSGWGAGGYFYVSYYDLTIGDRSAVFTGEPVSNYDSVYSYDPLGWVGSYGFSSPSARYANVFTARSVETLTAIGVYTTSPGTFTARIYLDPAGGPINTSGYVAETSWSNTLLGYQTVDIPDVDLKPGQQYSIVVLATTTGYGYPIPLEYPITGYSSHATARAGESYISSTGTTWTDMTTIFPNTSVCVKGFTVIKSRIGISRDGSWNLDNDGSFAWNTGDNYYNLGDPGATPVFGDWNGDDITEVGTFSSGSWVLDYNGNGVNDGDGVDKVFSFGSPGYKPVIGDWNGDGKDDIGVELDGFWAIDYNGNYVWDGQPADRFAGFGQPDDNPVVGDWNGDGKDEIGSEKDGFWSIDYNGNYVWDGQPADRFAGFGQPDDNPVVGDWNGDGKDEIGSHKDGFWAIDDNGNYVWDYPLDWFAGFGRTDDTPRVGDYNGNGRSEIASFKDGFWAVDYNGNYVWDGQPADKFSGFGSTGATPVAGAWS